MGLFAEERVLKEIQAPAKKGILFIKWLNLNSGGSIHIIYVEVALPHGKNTLQVNDLLLQKKLNIISKMYFKHQRKSAEKV